MSSVAAPESLTPRHEPPPTVALRNWPIVDEPLSAWLMVLAFGGVAAFAGYASQSLAMGVLCFAALNLAVWRLWLPVGFVLGPKGVEHRLLGRGRIIPWRWIRRAEFGRRGVLLLPEDETAPAAAIRGLYVRWGRLAEHVQAAILYYARDASFSWPEGDAAPDAAEISPSGSNEQADK